MNKSLFIKKSAEMDYKSVLYVITLVSFGILMVYSTTLHLDYAIITMSNKCRRYQI